MGVIRAYSFRIGVSATVAQVEKALAGLPIGDGILLHRVRGIFEDGHLVQIELHIGDPVTQDRIDLGRERLRRALEYGFITSPQRTGLDAGDPVELFNQELGKIRGPSFADQVAGLFSKLTPLVSGAGLLAAAAAVIFVIIAVRR